MPFEVERAEPRPGPGDAPPVKPQLHMGSPNTLQPLTITRVLPRYHEFQDSVLFNTILTFKPTGQTTGCQDQAEQEEGRAEPRPAPGDVHKPGGQPEQHTGEVQAEEQSEASHLECQSERAEHQGDAPGAVPANLTPMGSPLQTIQPLTIKRALPRYNQFQDIVHFDPTLTLNSAGMPSDVTDQSEQPEDRAEQEHAPGDAPSHEIRDEMHQYPHHPIDQPSHDQPAQPGHAVLLPRFYHVVDESIRCHV